MVVATRSANTGTRKGLKQIAWVSWAIALIGGCALMSTDPGGWIIATIGFFPRWVGALLFVLGLAGMVFDLYVDGIPNKLAVWSAILSPSISRAEHGQLATGVQQVASKIAAAASERMGAWIGQSSMLAVAAICIGIGLLMARRVVRKGGS